jgi:MFS family permease
MAGGLLAMAMLGAFLLAITHGHEWGWGSVAVLALLATALVTGAAFIAWQRRCSDPMLDLSMFRDRTFTGGNLASVVNYLALTTSAFLMPVLLQRALGFSPQAAGLLMALTPAAIIAIAPFSGAWSDRAGTRLLTVAGESAVTVALGAIGLLLTLAGAGVIGPERTVFLIAPLLALIGVGAGMFQSPNNSAVMGSVPRTHLGIGGGVLASMRNLGMAFGTAIGSAVTVGRMHQVASGGAATEAMGIVHGVAVGCFVGAVFAAFGVFTSLWRTAK